MGSHLLEPPKRVTTKPSHGGLKDYKIYAYSNGLLALPFNHLLAPLTHSLAPALRSACFALALRSAHSRLVTHSLNLELMENN